MSSSAEPTGCLAETSLADIRVALSDCQFAYLFGSAASRRLRPDSDIDIAVRFAKPLRADKQADLMARLSEAANRPADLVDLARADPIIRMKVLEAGTVLADHDPAARARFEMYTPIVYADFKIMRREVEAHLRGARPSEPFAMSLAFDADIVLAKTSSVSRSVAAIRSVRAGEHGDLPGWIIDDITVLNLECAIGAIIDLANHLLAANKLAIPRSASDAFRLCVESGIVPPELADIASRMVGFRNVAVHRYVDLNREIIESIVQRHLPDFERVAGAFPAATLRRPAGT